MKRFWMIMVTLALTGAAVTCSAQETSGEVEKWLSHCLYDIAQAEDGSGTVCETGETAQILLDALDAWLITLDEQSVILETMGSTYVLDACYEDGLSGLARAVIYKHIFDEFVEEELRIVVEREDLGSFVVTDENFEEYAEWIGEAGYSVYGEETEAVIGDLETALREGTIPSALYEFIESGSRSEHTDSSSASSGSFLNDSYGITVPGGSVQNDSYGVTVPGGSFQNDSYGVTVPGGSFQNDSYGVTVPGESFQNDSYGITVTPGSGLEDYSASDPGSYGTGAEGDREDYCEACYNTGLCSMCNGAGWYRNPYDLTLELDCTNCVDGVCPVCGGR